VARRTLNRDLGRVAQRAPGQGSSSGEISDLLSLSSATVTGHVERRSEKRGCQSQQHVLLHWAALAHSSDGCLWGEQN
jgi:orotate phosphoribosyltransferase-like protein